MDQDSLQPMAYSACPHDCPSTCALEVDLLSPQRIGRVRGARANSYTDGVVCAKVARYAERTHHPDRLTNPMRRIGEKGNGEFKSISWDDALDEVANAFIKTTQQHGSESVWPYFYAGTMGLLQRDGINRLRHAMQYSGQHSTICVTLVRAGWHAGVGAFRGPDPREMALADLIVSWGGNPASTQVNAMTHIQKARKSRNAKLVVVDPYRTRTAQVADLHLALRPGTDGALACGLMHILFRDGYADRAYLDKYSDCPERLEKHLETRTPEWAAQITGLTVSEIEEFATMYGETKRSFIRVGYGFSRSRNGAVNTHAVSCLPTVTGAWMEPGGGAFYTNGDIYHNGDNNFSNLTTTYGNGDIIGLALNMDAATKTLGFYKNGTLEVTVNLDAPPSGAYMFASAIHSSTSGAVGEFNFGNPPFSISSGNADGNGYGSFEFSVPSGYYALNTKNLAEYG